MKNWCKQNPAKALVACCYAVGLAGLLLLHLFQFGMNRAAYANGTLAPKEATIEDFNLYELELGEDGRLLTTGGDPRLELIDGGLPVDTVTLELAYSQDPYIVNLFYREDGEDYSVRKMAYAAEEADGSQRFLLPPSGVRNLRIDPGLVPGNEVRVRRILLNQPRGFADFFRFSATEWVLLAVAPGLVASAIWTAVQGLAALRRRKGVDAHD